MKRKSFWGWGYESYEIDKSAIENFKNLLSPVLGISSFDERSAPSLKEISLRNPRFELPEQVTEFVSSAKFDRASHSYGKAFRDVWRGAHGLFDNPPDYVAFPKTEPQIQKLFEIARDLNVALIPFGGGSSVTGGVEPPSNTSHLGVISVDMKFFDKVIEVDKESRAARIQARIFGPELEKALKPHGLTLRHFPQSFEFSTLGGWIATRSGGHYATLYTHIDEFVESVRMVTPTGIMQSRRLPGSGAGPSEERLICGSEGIFGIITEAWMRLQDIPRFKSSKTVTFNSWNQAVDCCKEIAQSGLNPTNARLVDALEAMSNGLGNGSGPVLILGFESHNHDVQAFMNEGLSICKKHKGVWKETSSAPNTRDKSADTWKASFLRAPYLRDAFLRMGCIMETFETAITWDKFERFHRGIIETGREAIKEYGGGGIITCRFTHLYPDGPAPYYTIMAKGQTGQELEQWDKIKSAVSKKIIELGGTITHHHAVGRDHQPFYQDQSSEVFNRSLRSIKNELDPDWILNPGVLIDNRGS